MKKFLFHIALSLLVSYCAAAQEYTVGVSLETYHDLQNPMVIALGPDIAGGYFGDFNFSFSAFGHKFGFDYASTSQGIYGQGLYITRDGYIAAYEVPDNSSSIAIFHGFLASMTGKAAKGGDPASSISAELSGTTGKRILKFQWKNMGLKGNSDADFVNFQLWLHESDTSVSVHIGPHNITGNAAFNQAKGPCIGIARTNASFDKSFGTAYLSGNPLQPQLVDLGFWSPVGGVPQNGTVYTFKAKSQIQSSVEDATDFFNISVVPQPAKGSVILTLDLTEASELKIFLTDIFGEEISEIASEKNIPGQRQFLIERKDLSSGIYFAKISLNGKISFRKIVFE